MQAAPILGEPQGFPTISGVDVANGLQRVVGNRVLYQDLLLRFAEKQREAAAKAKKALAVPDIAAAIQVIHSLKGVAANLGIYEVAALAAEIECNLDEQKLDNSTVLLLDKLETVLENVIVAILTVFVSVSDDEVVPQSVELDTIQSTARAHVIDTLFAFIKDSDCAAADYCSQVLSSLYLICGKSDADALSLALRQYDFTSATNLLKKYCLPSDVPELAKPRAQGDIRG